LSHRICTGVPRRRPAKLIEELADPWQARQESRLRVRRGGRDRLRAEGAGPARELVFIDRVIATLVILRFQLPHAAVALFYKVDRSTITRAVHEVRPLPAQRGFPASPNSGCARAGRCVRLRRRRGCAPARGRHRGGGQTAQGHQARTAGVRVGQEKAEHDHTHAISDEKGRLLWLGRCARGRMHDVTALRTEGIEDLPHHYPDVAVDVDSGYQGLARDFPGQASGPPKKPAKDTPPEDVARWEAARKDQSSQRICVEHAIAEPKQWRPLQRYIGRREYFEQTALAIAGLVSDRCAMR
jgi:hypothetical protein